MFTEMRVTTITTLTHWKRRIVIGKKVHFWVWVENNGGQNSLKIFGV